MKSICVYCGSQTGCNAEFTTAAQELGHYLATHNLQLVYGGGSIGLMGVIADAVLETNGQVYGVIPEKLATEELLHPGVQQMEVVTDMHARKALMAERADAFIAMPGGYGTLEELFEAITWSQLGIHQKPIGLLNVDGYFDALIVFVHHMIDTGFIRPQHRDLFVVGKTVEELITNLQAWQAPEQRPLLGEEDI